MIHFISGLPRSGSTLLAALLRQNPAFTASFQTPVGQIVTTVIEQMSHGVNEGACLLSREQRERILRHIFQAYYMPPEGREHTIFDANRRWCAHMALLDVLFPGSKVIACVRDPREIVASFERLFQKNPVEMSRIIRVPNTNLYDRLPILLDKQGALGYGLHAFREAYYGPLRKNLLVIDYVHLAQAPLRVLKDLHAALGEEDFAYDINDVAALPEAAEFDRQLGLPGLHWTRPKVVYESRLLALPPDILEALPPAFWKADAQKNNLVKGVR